MRLIVQELRERLRTLQLKPEEYESVIAEITEHLELAVAELRDDGEEEAELKVLSEVGNWNSLVAGIQKNKGKGLSDRFRKLWLPAFVIGFSAYFAQMIFGRYVAWPQSLELHGVYYTYNWYFIAFLIANGGAGAYWCREVGGSARQRVVVALAPAEIMAAVLVFAFPVGIVIETIATGGVPFVLRHPGMLIPGVFYILYSAVPSLLGATPFLFSNRISCPQETAKA